MRVPLTGSEDVRALPGGIKRLGVVFPLLYEVKFCMSDDGSGTELQTGMSQMSV